jgi:hypothetical protein
LVSHSTAVGKSVKIYPIEQLEKFKVNIERLKKKDYFEVTKIMDDYDPYTTLLAIDWAFNNNVVFNVKK